MFDAIVNVGLPILRWEALSDVVGEPIFKRGGAEGRLASGGTASACLGKLREAFGFWEGEGRDERGVRGAYTSKASS